MHIPEALNLLNILFAFGFSVASLIGWRRCRGHSWAWIKAAFFLLGGYWVVIYVFVAVATPAHYDSTWFGQTFIRPANTLTFGLLLAAAIIGAKRRDI